MPEPIPAAAIEVFISTLEQEGYQQVVTVEREAHGAMADHSHPFEAKALVLTGEIRIIASGVERLFQAGEVFHLPAGRSHSESYGPDGVTYLVGRR